MEYTTSVSTAAINSTLFVNDVITCIFLFIHFNFLKKQLSHTQAKCSEKNANFSLTYTNCLMRYTLQKRVTILNNNSLKPASCGQSSITLSKLITIYQWVSRNNYHSSHINTLATETNFINCYLKLPSLFAAWFFWTFHNKSHNNKALVILSHSRSPFLPLTCMNEKRRTFVGPCVPFWSIFSRKNSPQIAVLI